MCAAIGSICYVSTARTFAFDAIPKPDEIILSFKVEFTLIIIKNSLVNGRVVATILLRRFLPAML